MPAALQVTPCGGGNTIPFGPVHGSLTLTLIQTNIGNEPLIFTEPITDAFTPISGEAGDWAIDWTASTIPPGGRNTFTITFAPNEPVGTFQSVSLQFFSNAANGSQIYTFTGTSAGASDVYLQITQTDPTSGDLMPAVINFGAITADSNVLSNNITITNKAGSTLALTLEALVGQGYTIQNQSGTNPMPANGTITFQLQIYAPVGRQAQDDVNAATPAIPGQQYAQTIEALYSTPALVPAYTLTGVITNMLMGFGTNVLLTLPSNLTVEEIAFFTRQYDLGDPWTVKSLERLLLRYERLGATIVNVTYSALSPTGPTGPPPPVTVTRTLDNAVGGLLRNILFDGQLAGDIITIQIQLAANAGALSVVLLCPYVEQRGETIEGT
jgi:hypothetical protein